MITKGKSNIISAATYLFAKNGYDNTSIAQIIKKAKISKGGLYHHFESKDEILTYLINSYVDKLEDSLKESLSISGTLNEKISLFVNIKKLTPKEEQELYLALIFNNKDVKIREYFLYQLRKQLVPQLIELLEEDTRIDNADVKAHLIFGITESYARLPPKKLQDIVFMTKYGQQIMITLSNLLGTKLDLD